MKTPCSLLPPCFAAVFALTLSCALAGPAAMPPLGGSGSMQSGEILITEGTPSVLPKEVPFELGEAEFAPGDNITILQLRGTSDRITTGATYSVEGTYTLHSKQEADLAFYATTLSASGPTPVAPLQHVRVEQGTGVFHLVKTMSEDGYLHVSFYPLPSGSGFGGVYFGQGDRVLRHKGFSYRDENVNGGSPQPPGSASGANQTLLEYLGNPVEPPANLDARYTAEGLTNALVLAARNAGITVKKVAVDNSEFPILVGVLCGGSDFAKLKNQLKTMDGYEYNGSIGNDTNSDGSDTCNVFSIVPNRAYPPETSQRIYHRLWLREQVFYDQVHSKN